MAQPVVDQAMFVIVHGCFNATTTVVSANHDVLYLEHLNGILNDRKAVQVGMDHNVGNVAVYEDLARRQVDDLIGRHAAVGTAYPEVFGGLLLGKAAEEAGILFTSSFGPFTVSIKKVFQCLHNKKLLSSC